MKPTYWIGIMAVVGAIVSYLLLRDSGIGTAVGILVGVILYENLRNKQGGNK